MIKPLNLALLIAAGSFLSFLGFYGSGGLSEAEGVFILSKGTGMGLMFVGGLMTAVGAYGVLRK